VDKEETGLGGLYLLRDGNWIRVCGGDCRADWRIIKGGPLRSVVSVLLNVGGREIERLWCILGEEPFIADEIRLTGSETATLALALPPLGTTGTLQEIGGIWSFGVAAPDADAVGVAGCVVSPVDFEFTTIADKPAFRFEVDAGEKVRFAWTAGGPAVGDSSASLWEERARQVLSLARRAGPIYP
jgi:hypothetical protein